ncbi:MAG: enoyl-CoA hydratase [Rubrivivax sp. SCN 71-131]|jgi:2-(1,2-epoxy-1,2-dihydrophenyl)acetyl-CoA isomerase|nr:MAG: enoyl-CoA hydratase [Rubrivivax sp. SCN 71-131]
MSELDVQVRDGVATLTLNHPASRNALSLSMKEALAAAVAAVAADAQVRAVILAGAGGAFCAGGDLRSMQEHRPQATVQSWRRRMRALHPLIRTLVALDKPLVAAVDGAAFGAGFSLALSADFVLASPEARFCMSFLRLGLVPDFAAMYTLPRVVGVQRAKELMLSARELGAEEARQLGIALEVVPAPALLARAHEIAAGFVGASPLAVSHIKAGLGMSLATDLDRALADEADRQAMCFETESHRDAVRRFLAKEPASFRWPAPGRTPT